jgi:hypothetical protein
MKIEWTTRLDDRLQALHAEKITFIRIAEILNAEFGLALTRNACVGRAHRICLQLRQKPKPPQRIRKPIPNLSVRIKRAPPIAPGALTMLQLTRGTCRWPNDAARPPYTYCGAPVYDDRPFCLAHCKLAYQKPEKTWI